MTSALAREVGLQWVSDGRSVHLSWAFHAGSQLAMYCSTQPFERQDLEDLSVPIRRLGRFRATSCSDPDLAPGTEYFYAGESDDGWWYQASPVKLPASPLPASLEDPWILIDKLKYVLEVRSAGKLVKRYPVVLGANPIRRKLSQDRASTPEGRYEIAALQPRAQYHRAYDLNYPNRSDRARHKLLAGDRPIGGEIQIHGGGLEDNWTWGCIALRDSDMDELFEHPEIGRGTPVWIVGSELSLADLECDQQVSVPDPAQLGRWQKEQGLPVTCVYDCRTRQKNLLYVP